MCAGKYCGTAAMSNPDTPVRRSSSGELPSIGNVSSRFERSAAAGVTTSRSSLTTRTASWPARHTTMPRSSRHVEHAAEQVGQSSTAPSLASSRRPVRESARSWPVSPVTPGNALERLDAEPGEIGGHRVVDARVGVARERDVDGAQVAARRKREPRFEQPRLRQRREERRQIVEAQEAAAQSEMLDAVGIAPDVDVDGGRFGPGAAGARDGDVAQREPPGIARALPIAR